LAVLSACTAKHYDIEKNTPAYTGTFPGHYETLSACVQHAWGRKHHTNEQIIDGGNKVAILRGSWKEWGFQWEGTVTTFSQIDDDSVHIEFRQRAELTSIPEWIVPAFEACSAKGTTTLSQ